MTQAEGALFKASWIALLITGLAILVFGLIVAALPGSDPSARASGVASIGMGLFGSLIAATAFRRRQRWAWWCLWYYPIFWTAHLIGGLPPGRDRVHQVVFIGLSLVALVISWREFFSSLNRKAT
jgi:hypothetical protein